LRHKVDPLTRPTKQRGNQMVAIAAFATGMACRRLLPGVAIGAADIQHPFGPQHAPRAVGHVSVAVVEQVGGIGPELAIQRRIPVVA